MTGLLKGTIIQSFRKPASTLLHREAYTFMIMIHAFQDTVKMVSHSKTLSIHSHASIKTVRIHAYSNFVSKAQSSNLLMTIRASKHTLAIPEA